MSATAYSCGRARLAFLLAGTAAIALSAGQPVHAIVITDPVAAAADGIANYYDSTNQFPTFRLIDGLILIVRIAVFNSGISDYPDVMGWYIL